jgi:uncharacterized membrane protein YozB (DUF420 family)
LAAGLAAVGVRRIRRGNVVGHRSAMMGAGVLVGLFLVSYGLKVLLLGREDRAAWSEWSLVVLYVHEACIAAMVVAAGVAVSLARRFGNAAALSVSSPGARTRARRVHRAAGRVAVIASLLALLTAAGVLAGMYARAIS